MSYFKEIFFRKCRINVVFKKRFFSACRKEKKKQTKKNAKMSNFEDIFDNEENIAIEDLAEEEEVEEELEEDLEMRVEGEVENACVMCGVNGAELYMHDTHRIHAFCLRMIVLHSADTIWDGGVFHFPCPICDVNVIGGLRLF